MASKIKIKRSAVAGKVPLTTDLELSELAVNTNDGRLYTKKDNGTESIVEIGGPDFGSRNITTTGTVTGASLNPTSGTVPTNGVYLPSANTVGISTNSSERIRIGTNGEIGIGGANYGTSGQVLTSGGSGAAPSWQTLSVSANSITQGNTSATVTDTGSDGRFVVTTEGSERVQVDSSGRLLLGTSSTRSWSGVTSHVQLEGTDFNASSISQTLNSNNDNGAYLALNKSRGTSNGSQTVVQSGDQVGAIYFNGADGSSLRQAARIEAIVDGTPGASDMPGRLVFSTTSDGAAVSTERLRIANDGKMGFGTTTLTGKFNFDGSVFLFSQPSGAGNSTLKFNTSTGAVTYDTSSRLVKQNIEDCPYGLVELAQLKPRKYFRTDDQKIEIGFVADEVANVLPEFVPIGPKYIITKNEVDTEEIPLGVNYEKLTAVLTKALQETISEIESLKDRVAALESA